MGKTALSKWKIKSRFMPKGQRVKIFLTGLTQIGHNKIAFVLLPELKPAQKNQFGYLNDK